MIRLICMAALLTGCAHSEQLKSDDIDAIKANTSGAIILDVEIENIPCQFATFSIKETQTGEVISLKVNPFSPVKRNGNFAMKMVPEGTYQFKEGSCTSGYKSGNYQYNDTHSFPQLANAFSSINIQNGEVVYPGTIMIKNDQDGVLTYAVKDNEIEIKTSLADQGLHQNFAKHVLVLSSGIVPARVVTKSSNYYVAPPKPHVNCDLQNKCWIT